MAKVLTFKATANQQIEQAFRESHLVYYDRHAGSSRQGNYRYKATRQVTPWNKAVKAAYPEASFFEAVLGL
jgi:hypothetical protein